MNCEKHLNDNVIGLDCYNQRLTGGVSMTLTAISTDYDHVPCVLVYESHGQDCRYKYLGDVCSTVSQKYGTGGGNAPIVVQYEPEEEKDDIPNSNRMPEPRSASGQLQRTGRIQ